MQETVYTYRNTSHIEYPAILDIHFGFIGFGGSEGHCHIRAAHAGPNFPITIVCSQYRHYYGTSITNAFEIIANKLFHDACTGLLDFSNFSLKFPTVEKLHSDVNWFDSLLVRLFPTKYKRRFSDTHLDIPKLLDKVVWIERYPASEEDEYPIKKQTLSIVKLNTEGQPTWSYGISNNKCVGLTGITLETLLIEESLLDFECLSESAGVAPAEPTAVEQDSVTISTCPAIETEDSVCIARWIPDILQTLPNAMALDKYNTGHRVDDSLDEKYLHRSICNILSVSLPMVTLFDTDFKISKHLGIHSKGREKECDFVIYAPSQRVPRFLFEVKRTSTSHDNLLIEVHQDIARMVICSYHFNCDCYIVVCGDFDIIWTSLIGSILSTDEENISASENMLNITDEYHSLLNKFVCQNFYCKFQGSSGEKSNSVFIWQVSNQLSKLESQKAYFFKLLDV